MAGKPSLNFFILIRNRHRVLTQWKISLSYVNEFMDSKASLSSEPGWHGSGLAGYESSGVPQARVGAEVMLEFRSALYS